MNYGCVLRWHYVSEERKGDRRHCRKRVVKEMEIPNSM